MSLSFVREIFKIISICRQAHYLTQRFSLTDRPIRSLKHTIIYFKVFEKQTSSEIKYLVKYMKDKCNIIYVFMHLIYFNNTSMGNNAKTYITPERDKNLTIFNLAQIYIMGECIQYNDIARLSRAKVFFFHMLGLSP